MRYFTVNLKKIREVFVESMIKYILADLIVYLVVDLVEHFLRNTFITV